MDWTQNKRNLNMIGNRKRMEEGKRKKEEKGRKEESIPFPSLYHRNKFVQQVQDHIGSLNWGYRVTLRDKKIEYRNEEAKFVDPHTVETKAKNGKLVCHNWIYFF
jgi:pyruvate/2-oxoglutarate dehydrogenase complex dihydrolipoamide dehydrogenase (E3) component